MKHGVRSTVLEADPRFLGGLARTVETRGYRFDIGGHRFFSKSQEIEDLWTEVLGKEMRTCRRLSRIYYKHKYFDYPLKAGNALFNMGLIETVACISSYAWARLTPVKEPKTLEDWVRNQFGHRLFRIFFKTYTEKVWGISTKELSADWAAQRIKGLSLVQALKSALLPGRRRGGGRDGLIKTLIDSFRYPRLGPGQMWETMAERLRSGGNRVELGQRVTALRHDGSRITAAVVSGPEGSIQVVVGSHFISTVPMRELVQMMQPPLPASVREAADRLHYRDFLTVAVVIDKTAVFPDNWIYIHDPGVKVGRLQNFKNWSPDMVPDPNTTCLGLEYFCFEGDPLWSASDEELVDLARRELAHLGMCAPQQVRWGCVVRMAKAYPVYDDGYKQAVAVVRDYLRDRFSNLALVGRNGMHHYNNQDHSMMTALLTARNIALGTALDPWKVNTDAEYHEESSPDADDHSGRRMPERIAS